VYFSLEKLHAEFFLGLCLNNGDIQKLTPKGGEADKKEHCLPDLSHTRERAGSSHKNFGGVRND
jgi:hypothetical protein